MKTQGDEYSGTFRAQAEAPSPSAMSPELSRFYQPSTTLSSPAQPSQPSLNMPHQLNEPPPHPKPSLLRTPPTPPPTHTQ